MRIVFDLHNVGLENNGVSIIIARCADALVGLGCEVFIYSNAPFLLSWVPVRHAELVSDFPECDVVIATGHKSVAHALGAQAGRKFYYIRGFETWNAPREELFDAYRSIRCIVCSEWLLEELENHGIEADLVRLGIEPDMFWNRREERDNAVGSLWHDFLPTKRPADAIEICRKVGCELRMLNRNIVNPGRRALNAWYNNLKVWVAPTELEGLHMPPMEASLAGCALVCTDHRMSGMSDYAADGETALVYPARDLDAAVERVKVLLEDDELRQRLNASMVRMLNEKVRTYRDNMVKMLEILGS